MSNKKDQTNPGDPKPLNFDQDEQHGPSDHLKKPFMTPEDERGDAQDDQYYDIEEAVSPEEAEDRKEEDNDDDV
jgi:hypothetical protein